MNNIKLLICAITCFTLKLHVIEATINVCLPSHLTDATVADVSTENLFEGIKNDIAEELPESNLSIDHIDLNITHPAIRINGTLDNVTVYDLQNFNICFLDNIFLNASYYQFDIFNLTFTNVRVEGIYNITGDLGDIFDLYGDGDFWIELRNLSLSMVDFRFNVGDEICLPITINFDLQEIGNHLYNFMYDEELEVLFNGVITSIVPEALRIVWTELKDIFDKPIEDAINNILHSHNVLSVFNLLKNGGIKSPKFCLANDNA